MKGILDTVLNTLHIPKIEGGNMQKKAGVWAGCFFLLFSLVLLGISFEYDYLSQLGGGIGPGFLPRWTSLFLAIFSIVYIVDSIKNSHSDLSKVLPNKESAKTIALLLLYMVIFVAILKYVGFLVTTLLVTFLMFRGYFKWYVNSAVSLGTALFLYGTFVVWLQIPFPVNAFGW
jgi:putative tricarboxylic transport membrane protein